jgi:uncharacterized protein YyaL (SSP411 family)
MGAPTVDWLEFEPASLERARKEHRPILLLLTVPWCPHCRELLDTTFTHPDVTDLLDASFIAVRADAERRPDVNERYGTGGWPTIAFLTPEGDLIANEKYQTAEQLAPLLRKVRDLYESRGDEIKKGLSELWSHKLAPRDTTKDKLSRRIVEDVVDAIYEKFDHRFGGWGQGTKFPHPEAIDFALVQVAKRKDERMREVVQVTLDRMMEGGIHDRIDGGFFRYSKTPDWRNPNLEKVLDANAQRMRCYLEAYQLFGNTAYRKTAEGVVRWMLKFMRDEETGAFFGSQDADSAYYVLDADGRSATSPPRLDRTIYAHANAMTVSNLLKASVVLERLDLRQVAMQALSFVLEHLCDRDGEVYHYWDGTYHLPGLLADQAHLLRALIDASQLTGDADLLLPAEKIAENVIRRQRAPGGGFYDILQNQSYQGSMRRRNRSILENSVMAEALMRLSYLSRRNEFYEEARLSLEAFTGDYKEYGYYVSGFGRAVDLIFYEPLFVTIVGDRDSAEADALRRAALSGYVPSRIVQMLDPKHDPVLLGRSGYQVEARTKAYLCVGKTTRAVVYEPDALLAKIEEIERDRRQELG